MMLAWMRVTQLRALTGLEDRKHDHGDEGTDELREGVVDVEDTKIETSELAGRSFFL